MVIQTIFKNFLPSQTTPSCYFYHIKCFDGLKTAIINGCTYVDTWKAQTIDKRGIGLHRLACALSPDLKKYRKQQRALPGMETISDGFCVLLQSLAQLRSISGGSWIWGLQQLMLSIFFPSRFVRTIFGPNDSFTAVFNN